MHWLHLQCFLRMRSHISKRLEFPGYRQAEVIHRYVGGHVFRGELGGTGHCGAFYGYLGISLETCKRSQDSSQAKSAQGKHSGSMPHHILSHSILIFSFKLLFDLIGWLFVKKPKNLMWICPILTICRKFLFFLGLLLHILRTSS